ncbi:hypothetical protein QP028_04980 [Corynebacterium suedekumii]|nr:hypothetical protein QP028_04980 [Corynebacterium suedekumii]
MSSEITAADGDSGRVDLDVVLGDTTVEETRRCRRHGHRLARLGVGQCIRLQVREPSTGVTPRSTGMTAAAWQEMSLVLASPLTEGHHLRFGLRGDPELDVWWREPGAQNCDLAWEVDAAVDLMAALGEETGWTGDGDPRMRVARDACGIADVSSSTPWTAGRSNMRTSSPSWTPSRRRSGGCACSPTSTTADPVVGERPSTGSVSRSTRTSPCPHPVVPRAGGPQRLPGVWLTGPMIRALRTLATGLVAATAVAWTAACGIPRRRAGAGDDGVAGPGAGSVGPGPLLRDLRRHPGDHADDDGPAGGDHARRFHGAGRSAAGQPLGRADSRVRHPERQRRVRGGGHRDPDADRPRPRHPGGP